MLIHGVTYSRAMSVTEDAAIDRLNAHSAEVSTLYPHYGTHGLAFPFGWTNGIPTKPLHCHNTLPATPTQIPNGLVLGGPVSTKDTPTTVVVKTLPLGDSVP